jgi:hypothetical protein
MKTKFSILFFFFTLLYFSSYSQGTIEDRAVKVYASIQESPAQITLSWENSQYAVSTQIFRKAKTDKVFPGTPIATINAPSSSYTDNNVAKGVQYDYTFIQNTSFTSASNAFTYAWGGISAGIQINLIGYKGKLLIVADTLIQSALSTKFNRFVDDLTEEGWAVSITDKTASDSVPSIKEKIRTWYYLNPDYSRALILLGDIPVPYSGNFGVDAAPVDGHTPDHNGAWAADVYYGIMNENLFTDNVTNVNDITREENKNYPGDGKFDQSRIPGDVQLQVGRIDMSRLNGAGSDYLGRTERYFDKNHIFRNKLIEVPNRYVFSDVLALLGGEAPGRLHYFQTSLFGADSITSVPGNQYFNNVKSTPYLFSGVTSSAGYTSINQIGSMTNFADTVYTVFSTYFGSYFVDWDINNNFLRGAIAGPGYTLASIWNGRPVVHLHQMAVGENIGFSLKHAQENSFAANSVPFFPGFGEKSIHISLHGDPTLRMHTVTPISNLTGSTIDNNKKVSIQWSATSESNIEGYHVYRATSMSGPFHQLTTSPVTSTQFTDNNPWPGTNCYMVRTVKHQSTPSGSYYNLSQGRRVSFQNVDGSADLNTEFINAEFAKWQVFPNPSEGILNLQSENAKGETQLKMYDMSGRVQQETNFEGGEFQFDGTYLSPGIYIIRLTNNGQTSVVRWVKQ